jgi:hypothetical protein
VKVLLKISFTLINLLTVYVDGEYKGEMKRRVFENRCYIPVTNNFTIANKFADTDFEVEYKSFILGAKEIVKADPKGILI